MKNYVFTNFAQSTLETSITASATSLTIPTTDMSKFPVLSAGGVFRGTIFDGTQDPEIVEVAALANGVMVISRGKEGTTAKAWDNGSRIRLAPTAEILNQFMSEGALIPMFGTATFSSNVYTVTIADVATVPTVGQTIVFTIYTQARIQTLVHNVYVTYETKLR